MKEILDIKQIFNDFAKKADNFIKKQKKGEKR